MLSILDILPVVYNSGSASIKKTLPFSLLLLTFLYRIIVLYLFPKEINPIKNPSEKNRKLQCIYTF